MQSPPRKSNPEAVIENLTQRCATLARECALTEGYVSTLEFALAQEQAKSVAWEAKFKELADAGAPNAPAR